jgi:hypothetical protein
MCWGGQKKEEVPAYTPPTPPNPTPIPQPSELSPQTAQAKRSRIASMRFGLMSTMKTGARGITGAGPDLSIPAATGGKRTLGS